MPSIKYQNISEQGGSRLCLGKTRRTDWKFQKSQTCRIRKQQLPKL